MRSGITVKALAITTVAILTTSGSVLADDEGCTTESLAGRWLFATSIGHQSLGAPFPPGKDITAIGTMNISRDGSVEGKFDATVEDAFFLPNLVYKGNVVVYPDCTGWLSFETSAGSVRTDSIAVVSRRELIGMSQDPLNLWTYQARRIGRGLGERSFDYDYDRD